MNVAEIDFEKLCPHTRPVNVEETPTVFSDENYFYKITNQVSKYTSTSTGYFTLEGLDFCWGSTAQLAIERVGLPVKEICPAFHSFIYDEQGCCGYVTRRGQPLSHDMDTHQKLRYMKFVNHLAEVSVAAGWAMVSVGAHNFVECDGAISFIDLDFSPIKLNHGKFLNAHEQKIWENEFRSPDGLYISLVKRKLQA